MSLSGTSTHASYEVVLTSGVAPPEGNGVVDLINAPSINDAGQLSFISQLSGTSGGASDSLIMMRRETNGALTTVSRTGMIFNGKPHLGWLPSGAYIDTAGNVASVIATGPPTQFWHTVGGNGALTAMHTVGMPSPSGQSNTLLVVNAATVNDAGLAVYRAAFNGAQPEAGLYQRTVGGTHSVRYLQNGVAPRGGTLVNTGGRPTINEAGQIATIFTVDHDNSSVTSNISSIARIDGTTATELVRQGDLLPGGQTIGSMLSTSGFINNAGQVAFAANYTAPGIGAPGVFLSDTSGTTLVLPGNGLPGASTGVNNVQLLGISNAGRAAVLVEFNVGIDPLSGIYLTGPGGPSLVAFEDNALPVPGKFFRRFLSGGVELNDAGQMAFSVEISDTVNGAAAGQGLFFYDPTTGLHQIARTGDSLEGSTITNVYFRGTVDNTSTVSPDNSMGGMNGIGQVAFAFALANGNDGLAIWSPPEPGDYNDDGVVSTLDYNEWQWRYGGGAAFADGNRDGVVDAADYVMWQKLAGGGMLTLASSTSTSLNQAPEPASGWILATALTGAVVGRTRRTLSFGAQK